MMLTIAKLEIAAIGSMLEDDREAGDGCQEMATEQLGIDAKDRADQAARREQHGGFAQQPSPQHELAVTFALQCCDRSRRCQIIAPIAATSASTAAISTSSRICVSRESP